MSGISNEALIEHAASVVNPKQIGDHLVGDVGAALITDQGNIYLGVCLDLPSGIGFCAEHSAIAAMVTAGEYRIAKIVAVWKDEYSPYVVAPCGRCRELIRQIDAGNMSTEVILDRDHVMTLEELLPHYHSYQRVSGE